MPARSLSDEYGDEHMIDIGCCGHTDTYLAISQMGYDYVELSARQLMELTESEFSDFLSLYGKVGVPCRGFNDYCSEKYPIVGVGSNSELCQAYARKVCQRGIALGISTIGIGAPAARILPYHYSKEQADRDMADFLRYLCQITEKSGITILLEAVHSGLCNYLTRTTDVLRLVQSLSLPNLKIVLDYYHAEVMGEDLYGFDYVMPYVNHLHISTDLKNHARGFMREQDVPMMHKLLLNAATAGYSGGISVEAEKKDLISYGADCAHWMRKALLNINEGRNCSI